jgi:predicted phosphoribosyltransferase
MYKPQFLSRRSAGLELAAKLKPMLAYAPIVFGIPGGGLTMANEVAGGLHAPAYPLLVRKLGVPGHDQLSMGAISIDVQFLDRAVIDRLDIAESAVCKVVDKEKLELRRQQEGYLRKYGQASINGKAAVLVDEGIADNLNNIHVAVQTLHRQNPGQLFVGAPIVSAEAVDRFAREGLRLIWLHMPDPFVSIDQWYDRQE